MPDKETPQDMPQDETQATDAPFMVGIGASAGGLEATSLLAQNLPAKQNCVYVLAQHMSPSHKSMLVQLLSRETTLAVRELEDVTRPEPNTIYVAPPGADVVLCDGYLALEKPEGHSSMPKPSADRLFKSLAKEAGERSIGIVLSGTLNDGSYGVQAIREAGGITFAQEPSSSKFDSMPVSAIRTGCVDLTLTPQQIGQHLALILERQGDLEGLKKAHAVSRDSSDLFQILLARTLVDFRQYKESTVNRRIQRRMLARGVEKISDYVELCRQSSDEVDALYRDLLISVTAFFRDAEQFEGLADAMREKVSKSQDAPLRIWIPGCATGEEAYSIAIMVAEALGGPENVDKYSVQIFATDIDDRALDVGRKGIYPSSAINDIPYQYLHKYFNLTSDQITVKPRIKNLIMFTHHNVFQDAPFITLDLVSLRNVLIYFNHKLQERVLSRIQYSLRPEGLLFLGTSETTSALEDYFVATSPRFKIFRKRVTTQGPVLSARFANTTRADQTGARRGGANARDIASELDGDNRFDLLAQSVVTDGFLTNADQSILKIYGDLAAFIEVREPFHGGITIKILRKQLAFNVSSLVRHVIKTGERRFGEWQEASGRDFNRLRVIAYPVIDKAAADAAPLVLVGFETELRTEPKQDQGDRSDYLEFIETELARTRDMLNVTIEELQTSNEELQSLNEELQSANEELQSTNEELETSNEELQSTNEELITVNEELIVNTSELERATAELDGLVHGLPTEMLMLDQGLLIRQASRNALRTFQLEKSGQSFGHVSQCRLPEGWPSLVEICSQVLLERRPANRQFEVRDQLCFLSVSPLLGDNEDLIGLILIASTADLRIDHLINRNLRRHEKIGTWQYNILSDRMKWSDEVFAILGLEPEGKDRSIDEMIGFFHKDDRDSVRQQIESSVRDNQGVKLLARLDRSDGRMIVVDFSGSPVRDGVGNIVAMVGMIRDYSKMRSEDLLVRHLEEVIAKHGIGFFSYDLDNHIPYLSPPLLNILGLEDTDVFDLDQVQALFTKDARERFVKQVKSTILDGAPFDLAEQVTRPDGTSVMARASCRAFLDEDGRPSHFYGSCEILDD